jgi:hypothetical protein
MRPGIAEDQDVFPFYSSMVSHDWEALGYPSEKTARFWDARSCGVACLRMVYARLIPESVMLPAAITEELLRDGAYSEQTGWNHAGLARHAHRNGLEAERAQVANPDELTVLANGAGVLVVSIGPSFEAPIRSGHLAMLAGITNTGQAHLHRPSSQHLTEGRNLCVDLKMFWDHFSGRAIRFQAMPSVTRRDRPAPTQAN